MMTVQLSDAARTLPLPPLGYGYSTMGVSSRKFMKAVYQDFSLSMVEDLEKKIAERLSQDYFPFVTCSSLDEMTSSMISTFDDSDGWSPWDFS